MTTATRLFAAAYVIAAVGAVLGLWQFWTPRCNESCAPWVVLSMYATFVLVPAAALALALFTLRGRLGRNASLVVFGVSALCLWFWCAFVTQGATR